MHKREGLEEALQGLGKSLEISDTTRGYLDENYVAMKELSRSYSRKVNLVKCASLLLVCLLGIGTIGTLHPVLAKDIPILYQLFVGLNETFFKDTPYEQYAEPKILSAIDNDIEVTIDEVFCDQHEWGYTYTIRSLKDKLRKENSEYVGVFSDAVIKINGEIFEQSTRHGNGDYQDDYTYTGSSIYESLSLLPDQFELSLSFKEFKDITQGELNIKGRWDFETVVTKHTNPYSKVVKVNKVINVNEETPFKLEIAEVGFTPINTYIRINATDEMIKTALDVYDIQFTLIDDLGQVYLPGNGGMSRNKEGISQWHKTYSVPKEIPNWIAIVPSYVPYDEGEWVPKRRFTKVAYTGEVPVSIQRENIGDYKIIEIKEQGEDISIRVKAEEMQTYAWLVLDLKEGDERIGELTYKENGEIEWIYKNCRIEDIEGFTLEDSSERFEIEKMIKIEIEKESNNERK